MKRWDSFIGETPSEKYIDQVLERCQVELNEIEENTERNKRHFLWSRFAATAMTLGLVGVLFYWFKRKSTESSMVTVNEIKDFEPELLEMISGDIDGLELADNFDLIENLDLLEHLEELEKWNS